MRFPLDVFIYACRQEEPAIFDKFIFGEYDVLSSFDVFIYAY